MQCIDSLVQKVQSGVVINFEKIGPDPPPIDGGNNKEGGEQADDINQEVDKDLDENGDRNGVIIFLLFWFLTNWDAYFYLGLTDIDE